MRELLQSNFALKILSLILATLLWFAIERSLHRRAGFTGSPLDNEATLDLPSPVAALVSVPTDRGVVLTPPDVQIKLAGSPEVLGDLESTNLAVFVRVPPDLKAETPVPVEVKLPANVRLVEVNPSQVLVRPRGAAGN